MLTPLPFTAKGVTAAVAVVCDHEHSWRTKSALFQAFAVDLELACSVPRVQCHPCRECARIAAQVQVKGPQAGRAGTVNRPQTESKLIFHCHGNATSQIWVESQIVWNRAPTIPSGEGSCAGSERQACRGHDCCPPRGTHALGSLQNRVRQPAGIRRDPSGFRLFVPMPRCCWLNSAAACQVLACQNQRVTCSVAKPLQAGSCLAASFFLGRIVFWNWG